MIELGVSSSVEAAALLTDPEISFQHLTVGPRLERPALLEHMALFPGKGFLYHHGANIRSTENRLPALIATLQDRQRLTGCPWLSAHLDYHTEEEIQVVLAGGQQPPPYDEEEALDLLCQAVETLQAQLPVPLLLENMPAWPLPDRDPVVMPDFVGRVLAQTGCGLLVDLAHARVTAAGMGCDAQSYLEALPLDRVVEIHVSGPRYEAGRLMDAHEPLQEQDYDLLVWLLQRARPRAVTLEYWRDRIQLREQLLRLQQTLGTTAYI